MFARRFRYRARIEWREGFNHRTEPKSRNAASLADI